MSQQILEYAKPTSVMPTKSVWMLIVGVTLVWTMVGWEGYKSFADWNASYDTHCTGMASMTQTMRGQIELFKIQHADHPPAEGSLAIVLLGKTGPADTASCAADGTLGPYFQSFPTNLRNSWSAVGNAPGRGIGWVYRVTGNKYEFFATDETGMKILPY